MTDSSVETVTTTTRSSPTGPRRVSGGGWFVLPLVIVFTVFYVWPALNTVIGSFFRWSLFDPWSLTEPDNWDFVGFGNYIAELTSAEFWNAVVNTLVWLVVFPALVGAVALLVAVAIWYVPRGARIYRTVFILPMTISLAAAGVIWTFMYDPDFGTLPAAIESLNVGFDFDLGWLALRTGSFLSDPGQLVIGPITIHFVNLSLIVAGFWAFTGFGVITITAGLAGIPETIVEAARVDGAKPGQILRHIIIPSLRRSLLVVAAVSVIFALRTFDIVWVITQGGPQNDSEVLAVRLWKEAFVFLDTPQAGNGTAIAVIMSVALIALSGRYLKTLISDDEP
ncbi:MAG: ABC transporter permease subunit [Acidimicrobiia bacterium]|nr:ABC transporter permease subunit [Acidimicrobiia bacterium]